MRYRLLIACFLLPLVLLGQHRQLLYDFDEIPGALILNPGMKMPYQWYAGVPGLSGIAFNAGSSGVTVNDLFANDGVDINVKIRNNLLNTATKKDELSGSMQINLLQGGFRGVNNTRNFYSFGWYLEADAIGYWPKDLADLAYDGNADQLGRRFELEHLKTRGEMLSVFHFGINHILNPNITLGARAKLYSAPLFFSSTNNDGYFVTNPGQRNTFSHTLNANMLMRTSGLRAFEDAADQATGVGGLMTRRALLGGDLGFGIDLGFSYDFKDAWVITGSLLDLGLIYHSSDPYNYLLDGSATTEGVEVILPDAFNDPDAEFWEDLVDDIDAMVPLEENSDSFISFRPLKLYGSLRHNFGKPLSNAGLRSGVCNCYDTSSGSRPLVSYSNSAGIQMFAVNRPRGPQTAWTAFYVRRFGRMMALKATYTADKFTKTNIGLGVNLQAGPIQFYVMADNLLAYRNIADSHYASFQIGLNIISWGSN